MRDLGWLLIVDDDVPLGELLAHAIRRRLDQRDVRIRLASTPEDALRVVDEECDHPLVVLSDYDLKTTIDGITLLGMVRERCPATRRILYSGHPRWHITPRLTEAVDEFYEKPDRLEELVSPVVAHMDSVAKATG